MTVTPPTMAPAILTRAEQILAAGLGGPVRLGPGTPLRDQVNITRAPLLDGPPGAPATVVIKAATPRDERAFDPDATDFLSLAVRLFNEWAGLQLLQESGITPPVAPRFYGGDRALGFLIQEDLGAGQGLDHLLLGDDPAAATNALLALAAALGRMHAATAGPERQAAYDRRRDGLARRAPGEFEAHDWLATVVEDTARALDVPLPSGAQADLAALRATILDPGPFLAYIHGDPCPDNWLVTSAGSKLLDFEFGRFGLALLDGVYGRAHFPTCWCVSRLPAELPLQMEAVYRAELVRGCPAAADDRLFYPAVVAACAYWAITICQWAPVDKLLAEDSVWGEATMRQRIILRLNIAARLAAEHGTLEALGHTFDQLGARLRALWPEATTLDLYPVFR